MRYKIYCITLNVVYVFEESGSTYIDTNIENMVEFSKTGGVPYTIRERFVSENIPDQTIWQDIYLIREDSAFFNAEFICNKSKKIPYKVSHSAYTERQIAQLFQKIHNSSKF